MSNFAKGDRVRCVSPGGYKLTDGKVYEVLEADENFRNDVFTTVLGDDDLKVSCWADRFVKVEPIPGDAPFQAADAWHPFPAAGWEIGASGFPVPSRTPVDPPASDPVFRPHHYARFVIEPLTFINANKLPANIANVVKYVCRYDAKNGREDLLKARRYIDIQLECMDRDERVGNGEDPATVWSACL